MPDATPTWQLACCGATRVAEPYWTEAGGQKARLLCGRCPGRTFAVAYLVGSPLWKAWVKDQARRSDGGARRKHRGRHHA